MADQRSLERSLKSRSLPKKMFLLIFFTFSVKKTIEEMESKKNKIIAIITYSFGLFLSFRPKTEMCTYLSGLIRKSLSNLSKSSEDLDKLM